MSTWFYNTTVEFPTVLTTSMISFPNQQYRSNSSDVENKYMNSLPKFSSNDWKVPNDKIAHDKRNVTLQMRADRGKNTFQIRTRSTVRTFGCNKRSLTPQMRCNQFVHNLHVNSSVNFYPIRVCKCRTHFFISFDISVSNADENSTSLGSFNRFIHLKRIVSKAPFTIHR